MQQRRGFTLIELLVVIAVIALIAGLLLPALFSSKRRAMVGVCKSQIGSIKAALAMYEADHGRFPRLNPRPTGMNTPAGSFNDDSPALYMALRNKPGVKYGGGQNSPYLDWKAEQVGLIAGTALAPGSMQDSLASVSAQQLIATSAPDLDKATFQEQHNATFTAPGTPPSVDPAGALVFLDPWGNPYHYREWASVRTSVKEMMVNGPGSRVIVCDLDALQGEPPVTPVPDLPHSLDSFDIWSNGPNGVNEYGAPNSDDVSSWGQ